jgi:hypothetical protein
MSSTDAQVEKLLQKFWVERMLPAAESLRKRGVSFFATGPEAAAATYYHEHVKSTSPFWEIEPARAEAELKAMWQREGHAELVNLAGPLIALAPKVEPKAKDEGDVSPFIYVMF